MFSSIVTNIVASLVLIVGTALIAWMRRAMPAKRVWRLWDAKSVVICLSTSARTQTGTYTRLASGIGQIRALAELIPSLSRAYRKIRVESILLSDDQLRGDMEKDLIILGGPKNNKVTEGAFARLGNAVPITVTDESIQWRTGGDDKVYTAEAEDEQVVTDFGYVIRIRNPYNSKRTMIILAGIHTYGTTAAARFFVSEMGALKRAFTNDFIAIVKTTVRDRYATEPKLVRFAKLNKIGA